MRLLVRSIQQSQASSGPAYGCFCVLYEPCPLLARYPQVLREWLPSGTAAMRLNIDATKQGNLARFFNHSCDGGNLKLLLGRWLGQAGLRDLSTSRKVAGCSMLALRLAPRLGSFPSDRPTHTLRSRVAPCRRTGSLLPRVLFATNRPVSAGEELTWQYGPPNAGPGGRPCLCGTTACLGFMPHEDV